MILRESVSGAMFYFLFLIPLVVGVLADAADLSDGLSFYLGSLDWRLWGVIAVAWGLFLALLNAGCIAHDAKLAQQGAEELLLVAKKKPNPSEEDFQRALKVFRSHKLPIGVHDALYADAFLWIAFDSFLTESISPVSIREKLRKYSGNETESVLGEAVLVLISKLVGYGLIRRTSNTKYVYGLTKKGERFYRELDGYREGA